VASFSWKVLPCRALLRNSQRANRIWLSDLNGPGFAGVFPGVEFVGGNMLVLDAEPFRGEAS
jgi:hypothetical protein